MSRMTPTRKVAGAILALRGNENYDPDFQEIAKEVFGKETYQLMPQAIEEMVIAHLKAAARLIYDEHQLIMVLVGPNYYQYFRGHPIANREDAYRCLPLGHAVKAIGVVFIRDTDHPLLLVARERGFTIWENMTKGQIKRIDASQSQGMLSEQEGNGIRHRMLNGVKQLDL